MAAKGTVAKDNLIKRFATAVGSDYVGVDDTGKKYYFWSDENGEKLQVCIQMTVPKTPLAGSAVSKSGELNFDDPIPQKVQPMGSDEEAVLKRLREELGL